MLIYPAIDIKNGQCVRLLQGRAEDSTIYGSDPCAMARRWAEAGAKRLHIVDLDGAFTGAGQNTEAIARIAKEQPQLVLQLGGGIRTLSDVEHRLQLGISRVILGTAAIENPALAGEAVKEFGAEHIVVGIDAKDGIAAAKGWVEASGVSAVELGKRMADLGVLHCVYTDIARDGMLCGPNFARTGEMLKETGLAVIASGGMSCMEDLAGCEKIGCAGAIVGKAMYDGRIDIKEAIKEYEGL